MCCTFLVKKHSFEKTLYMYSKAVYLHYAERCNPMPTQQIPWPQGQILLDRLPEHPVLHSPPQIGQAEVNVWQLLAEQRLLLFYRSAINEKSKMCRQRSKYLTSLMPCICVNNITTWLLATSIMNNFECWKIETNENTSVLHCFRVLIFQSWSVFLKIWEIPIKPSYLESNLRT